MANEESKRAIQLLEFELESALAGEVLRAMPNLLPDGAEPFLAMRVGNGAKWGTSEFLPRDGRAVVVLTNDGHLVKAAWMFGPDGPDVSLTPLEDVDYRADLVEPFVRVVQEALETHLVRTQRRTRAYEAMSALARRVSEVVISCARPR